MMKINVAQTKKEIGSRQLFSIVISADKMALEDEHLRLNSDVEVEGEVVNTGRLLEVKGFIKTTANPNCNRCLETYTAAMKIPFYENYQQADDEISIGDAGIDVVYYDGDEIDISDLVHESIVLSEPIKTLSPITVLFFL